MKISEIDKIVILILVITFSLILIVPLACPSISAQDNNFYFRNITPQNDLFELVVYPKDVLVQGRAYNFEKVYGSTGTFAHWNNEAVEFDNCNPDVIITISYIKTNGKTNPENVYLDSRWTIGNWYQWDGCYNRYQPGQTTPNYVPYTHDNALIFKIIDYNKEAPILNRLKAQQLEESGIRGSIAVEGDNKIDLEETKTARG